MSKCIVFFGDSIIEYFDLQTHLKSTCSMYNCGIAGASTSILKNYIDEAVLKYRPQQVFIMAGTNDLGNTEMASPRDIAMNMKEILRAESLPGFYRIHADNRNYSL
mgnify:CR=1 FL=1